MWSSSRGAEPEEEEEEKGNNHVVNPAAQTHTHTHLHTYIVVVRNMWRFKEKKIKNNICQIMLVQNLASIVDI